MAYLELTSRHKTPLEEFGEAREDPTKTPDEAIGLYEAALRREFPEPSSFIVRMLVDATRSVLDELAEGDPSKATVASRLSRYESIQPSAKKGDIFSASDHRTRSVTPPAHAVNRRKFY